MFAAAGMPDARQASWSTQMIEAVLLHGNEAACERKIEDFIEVSGCDELILSIIPAGGDRIERLQQTLDWIGKGKRHLSTILN